MDQSCYPETENRDDLQSGSFHHMKYFHHKSTLKVVLFKRYNISSIYWLSAAYKINIVLQYFHKKFTLFRTPIGAAQLPNRSYFVPANQRTLCHQSEELKTCTAEPSFLFTLCQPAILANKSCNKYHAVPRRVLPEFTLSFLSKKNYLQTALRDFRIPMA